MGVLNVTPDSFSDGGRFVDQSAALAHACRMAQEGAAIIDVGGESTRPGARPVSVQEERDRVVPVIEALHRVLPDVVVSVDTSKPEVMRAAVAAGAAMINDVRALRGEGALAAALELDVPVCLMHMQGEPRVMQTRPHYRDVVDDVACFLSERLQTCVEAGFSPDRLLLDPGFGFGKTVAHNLCLMKHLDRFAALGAPLLIGVSRKSTIGAVLKVPVTQRLYGSIALAVWAVAHGAVIVRAHDVAATVQALTMVAAVQHAGNAEPVQAGE
ncbi:MAG TPA: dihydropteroate synthase [Gammaproteobacteria bacterium]|nr:dihydropteroate synthase [Gammaproteobacteria bacterium]